MVYYHHHWLRDSIEPSGTWRHTWKLLQNTSLNVNGSGNCYPLWEELFSSTTVLMASQFISFIKMFLYCPECMMEWSQRPESCYKCIQTPKPMYSWPQFIRNSIVLYMKDLCRVFNIVANPLQVIICLLFDCVAAQPCFKNGAKCKCFPESFVSLATPVSPSALNFLNLGSVLDHLTSRFILMQRSVKHKYCWQTRS